MNFKIEYENQDINYWADLHKTLIKKAAQDGGVQGSDLSWNEYQKYVFTHIDRPDSPEATEFRGSGKFNRFMKQCGGFAALKASAGVRIQPKALIIKSKAKAERKVAQKKAMEELRVATMEEVLAKISPINPTYTLPKREKYLERHQHLILSDLHFGSDLNPLVGVRKYGIVEEARSFAKIVVETVEHKTQYRKNTKIWANLNGDIIQGDIHDPANYDDLSKQVVRAINVLSQGIEILGSNFPEVELNCVGGNHDRNSRRHPDRAMQAKHDSWAFVIYHALKNRFAKHQNIKFNIPLTPFVTYKSFDSWYYGTHGDTQFHLPNPSGTVNVKALENEINSLNSRINSPKYSVVYFGHVHSGMLLHLSNGTTLITNPPLVPTDEYGSSLNINPDSPTGQWLIESVPGHAVGDTRFVRVTEADRQNPELSKVIDHRYWK